MKPVPLLTDPSAVIIDAYPGWWLRFWMHYIRDEHDMPFVHTILKITLIMMPLGVLLYFPFVQGWLWWGIALAFFYLNNLRWKGTYGLMTHCIAHRPLFKKEYNWLNHYMPWVMAPFFGQSPNTYFTHHVGMHHPENNLEDDDSCTMLFQRDSAKSFAAYVWKFLSRGFIGTVSYFHIRKRIWLRDTTIIGEASLLIMFVVLSFINLKATLWVFVLTFVLSRIVMMLGNWTQHAFVDYDHPEDFYKNSVTCLNTKYNHKCWNDGYHTSHHLEPHLHWTKYPGRFMANLNAYADNRALVFEGIDYIKMWWFLMHKNYDALASHVVNVNGMYTSREEIIALLKSRTRKMPARGITTASLKLKAQAAVA